MQIFSFLLERMLPLYFIIILGFIAGKYADIKKQAIAKLLIYIIAPIIVFNGVATVPITIETISLPFMFFGIASILSFISLALGKKVWKDGTANLLGFVAGAGNTGYFGIPLALVLFTSSQVSRVILSVLGIILFENSVGFYLLSRGKSTAGKSFSKIVRLPAIYAFLLGMIVPLFHISLPTQWSDTVKLFSATYTALGMMIVGLGISEITRVSFDWLFICASLILRYALWPIGMLLFIYLDSVTFRLFPSSTHPVLMLMASVPVAANTVTYATELQAYPEKASLAVLVTTIIALIYIPFITVPILLVR